MFRAFGLFVMQIRNCIFTALALLPSLISVSLIHGGSTLAQTSFPQTHNQHRLYNDQTAIGVIGRNHADLRGPVQCQYQPVKLSAEGGARIAMAQGDMFQSSTDEPLYVGLVLGNVYRIQVTEIPLQPGLDIYPTVELIDRVYPPPGQALRFAIPIVISRDDMMQALSGNLVTRVIYLEDPQTALPIADKPGQQRDFDIAPDQDALEVADALGRPVAIIRYGSRTPPSDAGLMNAFLMGCPPWLPMPSPRTGAIIPEGQAAITRTPHIPRDDLPIQSIPATAHPYLAHPQSRSQTPFVPVASGVVR